MKDFRFVVTVFHAFAHVSQCQAKFSPNVQQNFSFLPVARKLVNDEPIVRVLKDSHFYLVEFSQPITFDYIDNLPILNFSYDTL